jgi:error-prone DNA polymerase
MAAYVELHAHSNYSFLDGASSPQELVRRAVELSMPALALTDHDGLYGMIQFVMAAREAGIKPIVGAEVTLDHGHHLTLLAESEAGYSNLCRLISRAQLDNSKGEAMLAWELLASHNEGLIALSGCRNGELSQTILKREYGEAEGVARRLADLFGRDHLFIELQRHHIGSDKSLDRRLGELANRLGVPVVATNDVHYATPDRRPLQDVLTGIQHITPIDKLEQLRRPNAEFYLKAPAEMGELFADRPEALRSTLRIAERCRFDLDLSTHRLPLFPVADAAGYLRDLCFRGARERFRSVSRRVRDQLEHELEVIVDLELEDYFLIVWDILKYAKRKDYPAQGRGSSANSLAAYCLGITNVDPIRHNLLFERFLSQERGGMPDIDVDFSREGREDVIQYVYDRYGEENTAMVCNVVTYRSRSAVRDVGKALGFPPDQVDRLAKSITRWDPETAAEMLHKERDGLPWAHYASLVHQIKGFPRHLSIHVGGMVITGAPLVEIVPIERATMPDRVVTQWDKDDIEDAGLIKIDLLSLRTLDVIAETVRHVRVQEDPTFDLETIGLDDPAVYNLMTEADTIGLFQVESRAQMQMLPKMKPTNFEDVMIEVAIVRPGPIQGKMIHPYLQRRQGIEEVSYVHPALAPVLDETMGVILFQEQVMGVAQAIGGFTAGEGDLLRRAMTRKRSYEEIEKMRARFVEGALKKGLTREIADDTFDKIAAFGGYGFCKSHAAAFARTTYETGYLKLYHPLAFYTAFLNHQPLGFYAPEVIVEDAKRHGVKVLTVDVNRSTSKCQIEDGAIRLGFNYVKHLGPAALEQLDAESESGPYRSLEDFLARIEIPRDGIENLIMVGGFDSFDQARRDLLWRLREVRNDPIDGLPLRYPNEQLSFPALSEWDVTTLDYEILGLTAGPHITTHFRQDWDALGVTSSRDLASKLDNSRVTVAGLVITRQAPETAKGHVFISLEDEYGTINTILRPHVFQRHRAVAQRSSILLMEGRVVHDSGAINVLIDNVPYGTEGVRKSLSHDFH